MKKILLAFVIVFIGISHFSDSSARQDGKKKLSLLKPDIVDIVWVNYNNWSYVMRNNGSFMYDRTDANHDGQNYGGIFPHGSGASLVYAAGFYIGTLKNGIPVVSETEFATEFQPGRIINSGIPFGQLKAEDPLSPSQKVYLIDRTNSSEWPEEALHDRFGNPALIADAQTWAVFNDLDVTLNEDSQQNDSTPGLGIEVTLESYAFNGLKIGDVVYLRFILENKTNSDYTHSYFGIWADQDVNSETGNDFVGTDTTRGLFYAYNNTNEPQNNNAVGFDILQGPTVKTTEIPERDQLRNQNNKTVLKYDPENDRFAMTSLAHDSVDLRATSTSTFVYGTDPINNRERYNLLRGTDKSSGLMKSGSCLNDYFVFRGNPLIEQDTCDVAGIYPWFGHYGEGDHRGIICTGPFTIKAGESQEIWVGVVGATGSDRLDAVRNLFATDDLAQSFFNAGFPAPSAPPPPNMTVTASDKRVTLSWENNAESVPDSFGLRLGISQDSGFSADYATHDFQGYRVYRSLTGLYDSYELLAQYDKIDSFGPVVNRRINTNNHLEITEVNLGDNTGLTYHFTDSNLINGQNYYYSVTAYDAQPYIAGPDTMVYDGIPILRPSGLPVTLESSILANALSVVPANTPASDLKQIKVVPNPFYKYSSFETQFDKLIKFTHLPDECTIRIFTVAGDLVRTIRHNASSNNDRVNTRPYDEDFEPEASSTSIEKWDLKTANGRYVASGIYIALIESKAGKRFVKFAIIQ